MAYLSLKHLEYRRLAGCITLSVVVGVCVGFADAIAQPTEPLSGPLQITVNSPLDGSIQADAVVTLREAIALTNGTLTLNDLSTAEQSQLQPSSTDRWLITFDLPTAQTDIALDSILPPIMRPGVTIDGTTQPGYEAERSATAEIPIPVPLVSLHPAEETSVFRGLTISADDITVRGLSLYGFNAAEQITNTTPPADIFISHRHIPLNRENREHQTADAAQTLQPQETPPKNIVIEHNWLGLLPDKSWPETRSAFGVSVFDSEGTRVFQNRIQYHNGSGVITGRQADNLEVINNILVGNGLSGMPDAVRLDGRVEAGRIEGNLMCGNDGSAIFMFKPEGAVTITGNDIRFNGQRLRRAAVYVMGDNHQIVDNRISHQKGGGVVVTAFGQGPNTQSINNVITGNWFEQIEGLSIDLNARRDRTPQDFQRGDGPNPRRNSHNRRQDTGNGAVNAPLFVSSEFFVIDGRAIIRGTADANSEVQLYEAYGPAYGYGPLSEPLAVQTVNEEGEFEFVLDTLVGTEVLSAIATDPVYGTSEPAKNTTIRNLEERANTPSENITNQSMPTCTTAPSAVMEPPVEPAPIPEVISLTVPRNVHFALDEDHISEESAAVLDEIATVLEDYPNIVVELHGHTDSRATQAYNHDLAQRRAESARQYLLSRGIDPARMTIRSFGETALLVEETDRTNYARNRRVELVFKDVRGADITFVTQEEDLQIEP
ncbi:MAG: OmpA family protein [Cyanobacteria bacterium J06607_13]